MASARLAWSVVLSSSVLFGCGGDDGGHGSGSAEAGSTSQSSGSGSAEAGSTSQSSGSAGEGTGGSDPGGATSTETPGGTSSSGGSGTGGQNEAGGASNSGGSGTGGQNEAGGATASGGATTVEEGGAGGEGGASTAGAAGATGDGAGGAPAFTCPELQESGGGGGSAELLVADIFPYATNFTAPRVVVNRNNEAVVLVPRDDPAETDPASPELRWYSPTGGRRRERDYPNGALADSMAIDTDDSLWLGITNVDSIDFGGGTVSGTLPGYFVQKLSPTGEPLFGFHQATENATLIRDVVADGEGGVFVVAYDYVVDTSTSMANDRMVLTRHAPDGSVIFSRIIGSNAGAVMPEDAKRLPDGRLVVVGSFDETVDFGGDAQILTSVGTTHSPNGWVAVFAPNDGSVVSLTQLESSEASWVRGVGVDAEGQLSITGSFYGTVGIGTEGGSYQQTTAFVASLDSTGNVGFFSTFDEDSSANAGDRAAEGTSFFAGTVVEARGTTEESSRAFAVAANTDGQLTELYRSDTSGVIPHMVEPDLCGGVWIGGYLSNAPAELGLGVTWDGGWGQFLLYLGPTSP